MMKSDLHHRFSAQPDSFPCDPSRKGNATRRWFVLITTAIVLATAASNDADAQKVTIEFTGQVSTVVGTPFGIVANEEDPVTVNVTYDLAVADTVGSASVGVFPQVIPSGFSYTIGANSIESSSYLVLIGDTNPDQFTVGADGPFTVNGAVVTPDPNDVQTRMDMSLFNFDEDSFSDDSLPIAFDVTKFTAQTVNFGQSAQASGQPEDQKIRFTLESAVVTIDNNEPPTADAGSDQSIRAGDTVVLDGSASFDDDTLPESLLYSWCFASKPAGSNAVLDAPTAVMPSFVADVAGTYELQLVVTDEANAVSDPALVTISSDNLSPIAVADSVFTLAIVGEPFLLNGTGSSDPENDPISYEWIIMSAPAGSLATLSDATTSTPSFTPDVEGTYTIGLQVSDFIGLGELLFLEITASSNEEFAEVVIVDTADQVDLLGDTQVTTEGNQEAFGNLLSGATRDIQNGKDAQAIDKLLKAIERVDGCALRGAPDGNGPGMDWVTDCDEQLAIYDSLMAALNALLP